MNFRVASQISFKNKVAYRIFSLFFFCALVPLLIISAISFFFVGSQLHERAFERLHQQCKSQGFRIYEHLISIENEIALVTHEYTRENIINYTRKPYNASTREGSGLERIFLVGPHGTLRLMAGKYDGLPASIYEPMVKMMDKQILFSWKEKDEVFPHLFMKYRLDPNQPAKGYIVAEINPLYLFGIGTEGALSPDVNMQVRQLDGPILVSSVPGSALDTSFNKTYLNNTATGRFEGFYNGKSYINSYWSLFLRHRFGSPDWIIIFSQSKDTILSPFYRFSNIFLLLVMLTFLSIVLLSIHTIRKRTIPIETLKNGAIKIAEGEFGHQVTISSGDEFEDLARSFNAMSDKLKQGQVLLLQAAKMSTFGQMGAGIVHEIGQPLSAISGYAELMRMGMTPEKHRHYLEIICSQTQRLAKIISKFRIFSRASQEELLQIDINEILKDTEELMNHNLEKNNIRLEMKKPDALPLVEGDKDALQQVFVNLVVNAVDALEEKPENDRLIRIESHADQGNVHISVSDNGCGVDPKYHQSIFEPFFTTKSERKGTGLGLAVINSIVHKHKGKISLESAVGQGTRFIVSFPVAEPLPLNTGQEQNFRV